MQFLQAKSEKNKLNICNNLPYAIDDIIIQKDDILINLTNYAGIRMYVRYKGINELREEFDIIDAIGEIKEYKEYDY